MLHNNLNPSTPPQKKSLTNVQTKCNNDYRDSRWRNTERYQLDSWFSFTKPILVGGF